MFNARINEAIVHCVIRIIVICYIHNCRLWYITRHHLLLQLIASGLREHSLSTVLLSEQLLISLSCDALLSPTKVYRSSAARLHVTTSLNMFVHCGRPIH